MDFSIFIGHTTRLCCGGAFLKMMVCTKYFIKFQEYHGLLLEPTLNCHKYLCKLKHGYLKILPKFVRYYLCPDFHNFTEFFPSSFEVLPSGFLIVF
jgi:hypothetical protein